MKVNTKWLKAAKHPFNILILDSDYVSDAVKKRSVFELLEATMREYQTWGKFWMKVTVSVHSEINFTISVQYTSIFVSNYFFQKIGIDNEVRVCKLGAEIQSNLY